MGRLGVTAPWFCEMRGRKSFEVPEKEDGAQAGRPATGQKRPRRGKQHGQASSFGPSRQARGRWRHTYAAVDLGTSNCRLLVAKPTKSGFRVIDSFSQTVRLGEGVELTGELSAGAMDRALHALNICASKIKRRRANRVRAIATEACRLATNGSDFINRVYEQTGLRLDIIPADEEARLAVAGCSTLLDRSHDGALIFDIGGGSTELVWLDLTKVKPKPDPRTDANAILAWTSLPYGVVNLAERYGGRDVTPQGYQAMVDEVSDVLEAFDGANDMRGAMDSGGVHLLGTSGTVTTLAGIHLDLRKYDRTKVDGTWIDSQEVFQISQRLSRMSYEERAAEPCVGHDRADLVLAGCAIFDAIYKHWPCPRIRIADRGLREGMLFALMDKADRERSRRRRRRLRGRGRKKAGSPSASTSEA